METEGTEWGKVTCAVCRNIIIKCSWLCRAIRVQFECKCLPPALMKIMTASACTRNSQNNSAGTGKGTCTPVRLRTSHKLWGAHVEVCVCGAHLTGRFCSGLARRLVKPVLKNSGSPAVAHCAQPARTHLHPVLIKLRVLMNRAPINTQTFHNILVLTNMIHIESIHLPSEGIRPR